MYGHRVKRDTAVWACNSESNSKLTSGNHVSLGLLSSALSSFVNIVMKMVVFTYFEVSTSRGVVGRLVLACRKCSAQYTVSISQDTKNAYESSIIL